MNDSGKKYFVRVMIPFSLVMVLITVFFQGAMYGYFVRTYSGALCDVETDMLEQKSNNLIYLTENIKSLNNSIRLNYTVMEMCYKEEMDIYNLIEAQMQLDTIRVSSDLIHSIYLVNKKTKEIHVSSDRINSLATYSNFFDQDIFRYIEDVNSFGTYTPTARKITMENGKEIPVLTFFLYDYFIQTKSIDGIIIINVPIEWLEKKIATKGSLQEAGKNSILVIDGEGKVILDSGVSPFGEDIQSRDYVGEILNAPEMQSSMVRRIDGENCLISYYRYGNPDWIFIGIKSYSYIKEQLRPVLYFTLLISSLIFLAGMLIIWILSKRLADNYSRISQNMCNLEAENREHMLARRTEFIRGLLKGNGILEDAAAKFHGYDMTTQPESGYYVVLFEIDRFRAFCKAYNMDERNRILGKITEIIEEVFAESICCDVGAITENQIAVLCNVSEKTDIMRFSGNLNAVYDRIIKKLHDEGLPGLSAAVSSIGYGYEDISGLYDEAAEMIQYRYIMGLRTLLFPEMIPEKKEEKNSLVRKQLAGDIILALGKGNGEEACSGLQQYLNQLGMESPYEIKLLTVNLLLQVNNTVMDGSMLAAVEDFSMDDIIQEIMISETMDETYMIASAFLGRLACVQEEKNRCKYELLIQEIKDYIRENYKEENLSINLVAERVGLSVGYLGRLFKKMEGKSVSEYIMSVRLEKAEELLKNSQISINTIATQVGFVNNSYFYSVFKKAHGVTPNQWRAADETKQ